MCCVAHISEDGHSSSWQYEKSIYLGALGQHAKTQNTDMLHFDLFVDKARKYFIINV